MKTITITIKGDIMNKLTIREQEVFILIVKGYSNAEISKALFISESTVKVHVSHILSKLNTKNRVEATVFGLQNKIINI